MGSYQSLPSLGWPLHRLATAYRKRVPIIYAKFDPPINVLVSSP
jgi:hypothetical protein